MPASGSAGTSCAQPERTPQQSPKHGLTAMSPSRLTTPPQTIDRHASMDASSPVSAASSAGLDSSKDIASGESQFILYHACRLTNVCSPKAVIMSQSS